MVNNDSVTLVIPVYNEEKCIEKVLTEWRNQLQRLKVPFEFVIINDGSSDSTNIVLKKLSKTWSELHILNQENSGHGAAVKYGYIYSLSLTGKYIFQTDSDDQFSPEDFEILWKRRHESNAIFGIRKNRKDTITRRLISMVLKKLIYDLFEVEIPDANIPFRIFEKEYLRSLLSIIPAGVFAPNIFLSIASFRQNPKTPSFSVRHFDREGTKPKLIRLGLIKGCIQSAQNLIAFHYTLPQKIRFINENYSFNIKDTSRIDYIEKKVA